MNTRPHCSKSRPTGTGGQQMPGSTTASWRIAYAASPPTAGFRIRRKSYSISPGGMIPEPIVSVAKLLPDDRRVARMGLVGDGWAAGIHHVAADHQALAGSALWSCRRRSRRLVSLYPADNGRTDVPTRIRIGVAARSLALSPRLASRVEWLRDDPFGNAQGARRRGVAYFTAATLQRLRRAVVRRVQDRDGRRRIPGARG